MFIIIYFTLFFGFILIWLILMIISTSKRKGRWGINMDTVICPRCGNIFPKIRKPANLKQALWGGATCIKCGCEVDKWGKEINAET